MELPAPPEGPDAFSWQQIVVYAFYGLGIIVAGVLARLGFVQGKDTHNPGTTEHELVGALIDAKKADEIVRSNDAQTLALANAASSTKAMAEALDRNADAIENVTREIGDARDEIRTLTNELIRSNAQGGRR